eukprot:GHVR01110167.1.p1 GENE.GHVR01110167.1~~GHVR01110167.1.p1  ORF type:complete len:252 (-),score=113.68 GHVR01110167.1:71-826(-)
MEYINSKKNKKIKKVKENNNIENKNKNKRLNLELDGHTPCVHYAFRELTMILLLLRLLQHSLIGPYTPHDYHNNTNTNTNINTHTHTHTNTHTNTQLQNDVSHSYPTNTHTHTHTHTKLILHELCPHLLGILISPYFGYIASIAPKDRYTRILLLSAVSGDESVALRIIPPMPPPFVSYLWNKSNNKFIYYNNNICDLNNICVCDNICICHYEWAISTKLPNRQNILKWGHKLIEWMEPKYLHTHTHTHTQ